MADTQHYHPDGGSRVALKGRGLGRLFLVIRFLPSSPKSRCFERETFITPPPGLNAVTGRRLGGRTGQGRLVTVELLLIARRDGRSEKGAGELLTVTDRDVDRNVLTRFSFASRLSR